VVLRAQLTLILRKNLLNPRYSSKKRGNQLKHRVFLKRLFVTPKPLVRLLGHPRDSLNINAPRVG